MRFAQIENNIVTYVLPAGLLSVYVTLPPNCTEISANADVNEGDIYEGKVFRKITAEELFTNAKKLFDIERSKRFAETEWVRQRHADRLELLIDDKVNWKEWLGYWQVLRDLPTTLGFDPNNPLWPSKLK